jgi:laminin B (domain IV)
MITMMRNWIWVWALIPTVMLQGPIPAGPALPTPSIASDAFNNCIKKLLPVPRCVVTWSVISRPAGERPTPMQVLGPLPGVGWLSVLDPNESVTMYWKAPPIYTGNQSAAYGLFLRFKLATSIAVSPNRPHERVIIVGRASGIDDSLFFWGGNLPWPRSSKTTIPDFQQYAIQLNETGWLDRAKKPVTPAQFCRVLRTMSALLIQAEFTTKTETDQLDDVQWGYGWPSLVPPCQF